MKKIYMLINLIPLGLFYLWDCVLGIGISPVTRLPASVMKKSVMRGFHPGGGCFFYVR